MIHDELATKLARHLLFDSRMVYEDIPVGRSGSIRPDVLTIEKSYTKPNPTAYEIKVSVSDFRSDVTSGKWRGYLDYAWSVTFVVPKGLITKKDIPEKCGLITYNEALGTFTTVKRPIVDPQQLDTEMLLKLLIEGSKRETKPEGINRREAEVYRLHDIIRKKFGKDISSKISLVESDYKDCRKKYLKMKNEMGKFFGVDNGRWNFFSDCQWRFDRMKTECDADARHTKFIEKANKFKKILVSEIDREIERLSDGK